MQARRISANFLRRISCIADSRETEKAQFRKEPAKSRAGFQIAPNSGGRAWNNPIAAAKSRRAGFPAE